ncbi:hypothetical protein NKH74_33290 [Mesorhizobium sp. M0933]|uniref:ATP-dependent DNA ligase n=1 Tax=Mesorhizobium sp. M0933 TaxID=2957030 RepID=UPI003335D555
MKGARLAFIRPMEPKLVAKPPEGEHWIHEIKLDGYRTQIVINSPDDIRAFSSSGADWTRKYTGIIEAARDLDVKSAIFEGEAIVTGVNGLPDFDALQKAVHSDPYATILGALDIMHLDPRSARRWLQGAPGNSIWHYQAEQPRPVQRVHTWRSQGAVLSRGSIQPGGDRLKAGRQQISQRPDQRLAEYQEFRRQRI